MFSVPRNGLADGGNLRKGIEARISWREHPGELASPEQQIPKRSSSPKNGVP